MANPRGGGQGKRSPLSVKILSFSSSSLQNVCQIDLVAFNTPSRVCTPRENSGSATDLCRKMLNVLGKQSFRT